MNPAEHRLYAGAIAAINHHLRIINVYAEIIRLQDEGRRRRGRRRLVQVRPWIARRADLGLYDRLMTELRAEDPAGFCNFLRMPPQMFDELRDRLTPRLQVFHISRETLPVGLKLALTLRYFASGNSYSSMKFGWRVPHNTISLTIREVCKAIQEEYMDELMTCPTTPDAWRAIANQYMHRWNFPNTVGAIDGKHIAIKCPPNTGSTYYNYKGFFSVLLLGLVDADYKFIWADVSGRGAASDAQVFNDSELKEMMEDGTIGFPDPAPIPNDNHPMHYFVVGDDAFALKNYMMKLFSKRDLTHDERIFNYRLSRARRIVENAFGILAHRFGVFLTTMQQDPDTVREIIKTCLLLHNLMRSRYPGLQNAQLDRAENQNQQFQPGAWRANVNMLDCINVAGPNAGNRQAKTQRNILKHWCNSPAGPVEWQERIIA